MCWFNNSYLLLLILTSDNYPTYHSYFVIVSIDHVRTLSDVVQDPSRMTTQETAVMKYYNEITIMGDSYRS